MIKLEKTSVMNFYNAIRGARNPMNSWDRMDSSCGFVEDLNIVHPNDDVRFVLGPNDLALMRRLVKAGSDHRKFLRQIFVSVDITAPRFWWAEYDTYKIGTVANSTSTMHKIHSKEFIKDDFSIETCDGSAELIMAELIDELNRLRNRFNETKNKKLWRQMIEMLPASYNQLRTCTLNYEVLLNQYHARKHHKLDEWHTYCDWIESLPYFKEMCLKDDENE